MKKKILTKGQMTRLKTWHLSWTCFRLIDQTLRKWSKDNTLSPNLSIQLFSGFLLLSSCSKTVSECDVSFLLRRESNQRKSRWTLFFSVELGQIRIFLVNRMVLFAPTVKSNKHSSRCFIRRTIRQFVHRFAIEGAINHRTFVSQWNMSFSFCFAWFRYLVYHSRTIVRHVFHAMSVCLHQLIRFVDGVQSMNGKWNIFHQLFNEKSS